MRSFFHSDGSIYKRRLKRALITILVPLAAVAVFCTAVILFSFRPGGERGIAAIMLYIIVGCVAAGIAACFLGAYTADKKIRRHARYTYFDILPKGMIFSRYAGEHCLYGERTVYRRLYYIPFSGLTEISRAKKTAPHDIVFCGEIRMYLLPSDCLGYHINADGELMFDHPELSERFYTTQQRLVISEDFGNTGLLEAAARHYLEIFRNTPDKKPFNIADYVAQKSKKPLRTSNPLLDAPSFNRKW
ncbi:MAG: hypothetical protein ACI4KA_05190 [Oscillospiraceae bacterium]